MPVRVYTEERDRPTILVVDQRTSMFFGSRRKTKAVVAAEAAALVAWRVLDQDDRVGAIVFGDREIQVVRPHRSSKTVMHMLEEIVRSGGHTHIMLAGNPRLAARVRKALPVHLHRKLVDVVPSGAADRVVFVAAGLPLVLKESLS